MFFNYSSIQVWEKVWAEGVWLILLFSFWSTMTLSLTSYLSLILHFFSFLFFYCLNPAQIFAWTEPSKSQRCLHSLRIFLCPAAPQPWSAFKNKQHSLYGQIRGNPSKLHRTQNLWEPIFSNLSRSSLSKYLSLKRMWERVRQEEVKVGKTDTQKPPFRGVSVGDGTGQIKASHGITCRCYKQQRLLTEKQAPPLWVLEKEAGAWF